MREALVDTAVQACPDEQLKLGVPLRTVMEQLGHSQISLTANTYSHVAPELKRDAANRLGKLLRRRA